ncbi:MAG: winged helix-turn-helix domain-containing protein [Nitrosotalea sp.]
MKNVLAKQDNLIPAVKEIMQIVEKQTIPVPKVKKLLLIVEKQAPIHIPKVKKLLRTIKKQTIPIAEVKEIIEIVEKQTIPIPEVKEVLQFIETAKTIPKKEFEPSMKVLLRIVKTLTDKGPKAKTDLSLDANLNYSRLATHIFWLEKKGFVESKVDKSKISVGLTQKGRIFGTMLL